METMKWLRLRDVHLYVQEKTGMDVSRATVYNWVKQGRLAYDGKRVKLKTRKGVAYCVTCERWVDEFIRDFQGEE
jgi:predicted DNA-binding transcriptional regulator AlpA